MNNSGESVLRGEQLTRYFSQGDIQVEVLKGIDLDIKANETLAIVGASGSGKSTLLHLLGGLDDPTSGQVFVLGKDFATLSEAQKATLRNRHLGFVYQFHHLLAEFTALENVALPLLMQGLDTTTASARAESILQDVGLGERTMHKPGELSGGERQRAALARAMVTKPACLLADEPTGNLDRHSADQVVDLLLQLNEQTGTSLVLVTHDHEIAKKMDRTITIEDGQFVDI
ncbi:MAG: lipoprotein-releasing ABC transporter ATP-binding protein LolD [Gammaproteobacteria bacterium]|nr:lipoprotein-releasing ABC transporter ATP-binding protein LolD [Gammaproteobacteria bacterium]